MADCENDDDNDFSHVQIIQEQFMFLAASLDVDLSTLCEASVLSADEVDEATKSPAPRSVMLLRLMFHKPRRQFDKLMASLEQQQHQQHVVKHIRGEGSSSVILLSFLCKPIPFITTTLGHSLTRHT